MDHRTLPYRDVATEAQPPLYSVLFETKCLGIPSQQAHTQHSIVKVWFTVVEEASKKLHTQLQPEQFQLKRRQAWEILFNLTCFSRAPFEEAKRLRSGRYVPDEIYSLIRLSNCLEEPGKSKARKILKSVCVYRNMTWPKSAMGLQLRFTSHPSFCSEVSAWIRKQVLSHKHVLVPFHLPLFKIREGPHQTLKDFLHNFTEWDAWLQHHSIDDAQCPCSKFAAQLPESCMTHGHVVAGIE